MDIVSTTLPIYAHYFHALSATETDNLFDSTKLDGFRGTFPNLVAKVEALQTGGIIRADGNDLLIPLEGKLVMPSTAGATNIPLVLIGHGMALGYFDSGTNTLATNQVLSYNGYQVLQDHLASNGIASCSINLNMVNALNAHNDYYQRIQIFFLHLLTFKFLAGQSITIPASDPFPIKYLVGTQLKTMAEALTMSNTPGSDPALQALQSLKGSLNEKIDFTNLGMMGHSRGATAVSRIFEYFFAGTTAGEASSEFNVNATLNNKIKKLVGYCGNPTRDRLKCILALQPDDIECKIESTKTMFVVVAGTHDEDVGGEAASIYENVHAPKVMFFVHGATHGRFNRVWRRLSGKIEHINKMIAGDPAIRVLSNRRHDDIAKWVFGSCFIATLNNSQRHYLYFTRDVRFPIRVDIERAWQFGFPFQSLPAAWKKFDGDLKNIHILNATNSGPPDTTVPFDELSDFEHSLNTGWFGNDFSKHLDFTNQAASAFLYHKPTNSNTAALTIPIDVNLSSYTHFSFRFAKWYKVRNSQAIDPSTPVSGIPRRVDLRNFTIQLLENNNPIGVKIDGSNVRSVLLRAYPTLKFTIQDGSVYYWDTSIVLQTVEVHKSEFRVANATDFDRVNKVIIELTPEAYKAATDEDIFVFNDVIVTKRDISLPSIP